MSIFLQPSELAELTGVRQRRGKKTREVLQIEALRKMKIPHYVNAANRPVVARAVIEGGAAPSFTPSWSPSLG